MRQQLIIYLVEILHDKNKLYGTRQCQSHNFINCLFTFLDVAEWNHQFELVLSGTA